MPRPKDSLPPPPELPSFTVEGDHPVDEDERDRDARIAERHAGTGLVRHDAPLADESIDSDAAKVVRRLERSGFQAYLVGGCVRDLLLNGKPKDFDIATDARPDDVRGLFRNCRVIGRRFRLAHVLFAGGKVIEVATFRRNPTTGAPETSAPDEESVEAIDDLLIRNDNVFGEAHEDAIRRDFTINALFYDLDRRQVLDWCGGMSDVERRTIHTIGEPHIRFREDPIRILRAIKFAARLDLGITPEVYDAMVACREELARAARPRVFEEIMRLMRGGAAHRSMWLLWEMGCMAVLLPELSAFLDDDEGTGGAGTRFFKRLDALDQMTKDVGRPLDDVVLWMALLHEPLMEACEGERDGSRAASDFLEPLIARIAMPRRIADALRRLAVMLPRLEGGKVGRLARTEFIGIALDALELDFAARGEDVETVDVMREQAGVTRAAVAPVVQRERGDRDRGRGRSRGPRHG